MLLKLWVKRGHLARRTIIFARRKQDIEANLASIMLPHKNIMIEIKNKNYEVNTQAYELCCKIN